ncbi:hypothetical protein [Nitriliruptor alkaliphilus]|uniref:hypothetical protein n=1 Tax=Nitriliruptor alkaliphilus TaxID=427918 RepID=UPI0006990DB7|nr:hypothetical protein [Nitriliruptor alkaliphilus]
MSSFAGTLVIAEMQARDLLRRRAVMVLFVLLPAAFYYSVPGTEDYGLLAGSMGVSWAVAAAGIFGILGWRRADPRLGLAGASAFQGLVGRLLLLQGLGLVLVALFAPQILARSSTIIADPPLLVVSLALMALVSVPLGLAIGALVPRELEGTLVLIGVIGVGSSVPMDSAVARALPLWGPLEVMQVAAGRNDVDLAPAFLHTAFAGALLLLVADLFWRRRNRIHH